MVIKRDFKVGREVCGSIVGITGLIDTHTQGYEDNMGGGRQRKQ